jgi:hypothetical protein
MPHFGGYNFVMVISCGLSRFTRAYALSKKCDGETVLKILLEEWIAVYVCPKQIHSDQDIRLVSPSGWYRNVLGQLGVEVTFGVPYGKRHNPLAERQNRTIEEHLRILMLEHRGRNWVKLLPLATFAMNMQPIGLTGISPNELFLGRPSWNRLFPFTTDTNPRVEEWVEHQDALTNTVRKTLEKVRSAYLGRENRRRVPAVYEVGDWVLVHHERLPRWTRTKVDCPWFGPFCVTKVARGSVFVKCAPRHGGTLEVGLSHLKHYWDDLLLDGQEEVLVKARAEAAAAKEDMMEVEEELDPEPEEPKAVDMTLSEQESLGFFNVSGVLRARYQQGWRFLTTWEGFGLGEATWEPPRAFAVGRGRVNAFFEEYCTANDLPGPLATARKISANMK